MVINPTRDSLFKITCPCWDILNNVRINYWIGSIDLQSVLILTEPNVQVITFVRATDKASWEMDNSWPKSHLVHYLTTQH